MHQTILIFDERVAYKNDASLSKLNKYLNEVSIQSVCKQLLNLKVCT